MVDGRRESRVRRARRRFWRAVSLIAVAVSAAGCATAESDASGTGDGGAHSLGGELIWADYGGPTNEARQEAYFASFEAETGVEVVSVTIADAIMQSMLTGDGGEYDLFQASIPDTINNVENLMELPDDARSDLLPESLQPYGVGGFYLAFAQGWLTETFPEGGPEDWVDFFDVESYPGLRAWPGSPGSFDVSLEVALLADGVPPEDLYPLDFDRAYAKMDELRPHLIFYTSYPEVQQLLTSGSASMAVTVSGQYTALANAGEDVTVQWNEAIIAPNIFVIPRTASNPDAAVALARWMNAGEREAVFSERTLYGPVNSATFDVIPESILPDLANSPENTGNIIARDDQYRATVFDELLSTYTDWLGR